MSWYTTFNGFKDSVFANGQGLIAGLSSMAIQVILLGGILNIIPISIDMNNVKKKKVETGKKISAYLGFLAKILCIWLIFILAMVTSITFSYIDIANNIYATDYAVNANIKLDEFMRTTIQGMETDNQEYLDGMRERLIEKLKENGEDIIKESAKKRGKDYAQTTAKLLYLVRTEELISLDDKIFKFENKDLLREKFSPNTKAIYEYHFIKKSYVDKLYKDFIREHDLGNTPFSAGLKNKINNLNRDKLAIFSEYYFQYTVAVKTYNKWLTTLKNGKKEAPSLEKMRSLSEFCETINSGLDKVEDAIDRIREEKAPENTKRIKSEAIQNMDSLKLEADNVKNKVDLLIKHTYFGENSLSFEQLISAFGSSETTLETLDQARKQLLEMQGVFLAGEYNESETEENQSETEENQSETEGNQSEEEEKIGKVTSLMHDIEKYIEAVRYDKNLQLLKQKISKNYNVVKNIEKSDYESVKTVQPKSVSKSAIYESPQNESMKTAQPKGVSTSAVSESPQNESVSEAALYAEIEENEKNSVVSVTSEEWTNEKKKQMVELEGMIFNHPVNLYCPEVEKDGIKDGIKDDITQSPSSNASSHPEDVKKIWEKQRLQKTKNISNKIIDFLLHREGEDITPEEKKCLEGEENKCWTTYYQYKADAVEHRKLYLDTSEMEKAYNLLAGAPEYFPYKGKALMAIVFAMFLDFGAFLLGVVMFFSKKGTQKKRK